jgi:hypothetical protein
LVAKPKQDMASNVAGLKTTATLEKLTTISFSTAQQ